MTLMTAMPDVRPEPHWPDPPVSPFRLLHLQRNESLDLLDRLAFDVYVEVSGFLELCAPCLYLLAPQEARCGFALAEHAPTTHNNRLMMTFVDQDRVYEALADLEERVRMRAKRMLAPALSTTERPPFDVDESDSSPDISEVPSWVTEAVPYDADSLAFASYVGDDDEH